MSPSGQGRVSGTDRLLWVLLIVFPIAFAVADDRSDYSGSDAVQYQNALGGTGTMLAGAALCVGGVACLSRLLASGKSREKIPGITLAIIAMFGVSMSAEFAKNGSGGLFGLLLACVLLTAVSLARSDVESLVGFIRSLLRIQVLASIVLGFALPLWALVPPEFNSREFFGLSSRLIGLTAGPEYMGKLASTLFLLEISFKRGRPSLRLLFGAMALLGGVWSQSRTSVGLMAIGALMVIVLSRAAPGRRIAWSRIITRACIAAALVVPMVFIGWMKTNPSEVEDLTTGRVYIWMSSLDLIADSPAVGVTRDQFEAASRTYTTSYTFANAHNQFLESAVNGGLLAGLLTFVLLLILSERISIISRSHFSALVVSLGIFVQLSFGTPLRLSGLTWNLAAFALLVLCAQWRTTAEESDDTREVQERQGALPEVNGDAARDGRHARKPLESRSRCEV